MPMQTLQQLKPVEIGDVWNHEATDFTPWLAEADNISLLSEALGIELKVEGTEQYVGPFKADILCRNLDDHEQRRVVIENQLGQSDHSHLGQLLTYTAGLEAFTNVWIARKIRDEHRAALDWLNEFTKNGVDFFGVELELWRIGDSAPAPRFNVVCRPNTWSETVAAIASTAESKGLSTTQQTYLEYWTAFNSKLEQRDTPLRVTKVHPQNWHSFSVGKADFGLEASITSQYSRLRVQFYIGGPDRKAYFSDLQAIQQETEPPIDEPLEWYESSKYCYARIDKEGSNIDDRNQWNEQHDWLIEHLEALFNTFVPHLNKLTTTT